MLRKKTNEVKVQKQSPTDEGWQFIVWVGEFSRPDAERNNITEYIITLDREYWQKLTGGVGTPADLIKRSLEFLLKRESKESILKSFDLRLIKKHFPEYEKEIAAGEPYKIARLKK